MTKYIPAHPPIPSLQMRLWYIQKSLQALYRVSACFVYSGLLETLWKRPFDVDLLKQVSLGCHLGVTLTVDFHTHSGNLCVCGVWECVCRQTGSDSKD